MPFLICLVLIPLAFYLRSDMPETLDEHRKPGRESDAKLAGSIGYIALGVLLIIGGTVSTYVGNYMSTYAINTLKLPATLSLSATLVSGASTFVFALVGGWLGDRYGRKVVVLVAADRAGRADLAGVSLALRGAERRSRFGLRDRGLGPDGVLGRDQPRRHARTVAEAHSRDRLRALLRDRRHHFRRLDAIR